jgi:HSP20 family protein
MAVITSPESPFGHMASQMNKMIDQIQKGYYNFYPSETWTPNVNLYETDTAYLVCVDLAGVNKEKIEIELVVQRLTLRGHRIVPTPQGHDPEDPNAPRIKIHLMEIDHGSFAREVELPVDVNKDKISATHREGLLWIELPKKG